MIYSLTRVPEMTVILNMMRKNLITLLDQGITRPALKRKSLNKIKSK